MNRVIAAHTTLESSTCPGNDFLGWLHLPSSTPEFLAGLQSVAEAHCVESVVVVVAGHHWQLPWARAVINSGNSFSWLINDKKDPTIVFADNMGEDYLAELTTRRTKKFGCNISSQNDNGSGSLAFRLFEEAVRNGEGKERRQGCYVCDTDAHKEVLPVRLRQRRVTKYTVIPDNVGGRFSVLTPVGLLL